MRSCRVSGKGRIRQCRMGKGPMKVRGKSNNARRQKGIERRKMVACGGMKRISKQENNIRNRNRIRDNISLSKFAQETTGYLKVKR